MDHPTEQTFQEPTDNKTRAGLWEISPAEHAL